MLKKFRIAQSKKREIFYKNHVKFGNFLQEPCKVWEIFYKNHVKFGKELTSELSYFFSRMYAYMCSTWWISRDTLYSVRIMYNRLTNDE